MKASSLQRHSPLQRRTPLRSNPESIRAWKQRSACRLKSSGPVTRRWDRERRLLRTEFMAAGITRCELTLPGCFGEHALGFAHTKKRRNITVASGDLRRVVLACSCCHDQVEAAGELVMGAVLEKVIDGRTP